MYVQPGSGGAWVCTKYADGERAGVAARVSKGAPRQVAATAPHVCSYVRLPKCVRGSLLPPDGERQTEGERETTTERHARDGGRSRTGDRGKMEHLIDSGACISAAAYF